MFYLKHYIKILLKKNLIITLPHIFQIIILNRFSNIKKYFVREFKFYKYLAILDFCGYEYFVSNLI